MRRIKFLKLSAIVCIVLLIVVLVLSDVKETQYLFREIRKYPFADKIGHFFLLGSLALTLNILISFRKFQLGIVNVFISSSAAIVLITIEEISQIFIPNRTFDLMDLFASYLGIVAFDMFSRWIFKRFLEKNF